MSILLDTSTSVPISLLDYLSRGSIITFLIVVVYGGYKKWWVFGWIYQEKDNNLTAMTNEKNAWRETALKSSNIATKAFDEARRQNFSGGD